MQEEIWFQKYRIIRLLGSGGTAQVYLAEHIRLNSFRAIKFIKHEHPFYNLQLKEAQILKNLKHSCIPIIYDIEENEDGSYIIEQYLEGDTLASYVNTRGTINYDIIIHFALQLCDLIQYLHSIDRPILYLDLKPENIIITGQTCKLVDFGSAIYRDEAYAGQDYYATKGYAAPELYHHTDIDERCDVYGIGMLLYYMATGVPVKEDMNNIDFYKQCPNNLRKVINRCLKYNPSERFASVTHLSKQLSVIGKKNIHLHKSGSSVRFAVAGAQPRIGVTHLSFQICSYYIYKDMGCLYHENNSSRCIWQIKSRYGGSAGNDGIFKLKGIPMLGKELYEEHNLSDYSVIVEDFGCLTEANLVTFMEADVKLLVLGAKDWELSSSEQVLNMVAEYKDIIYLFNFLDGRQYQHAMRCMDKSICYRIPYAPDPFSNTKDSRGQELFMELDRLATLKVKD